MRFRKPKRAAGGEAPRDTTALDGRTAAATIETQVSDAVFVETAAADADADAPPAPVAGRHASVEALDSARDAVGAAVGACAAGARASAFVERLSDAVDVLRGAAGKRLPLVVHLTCRGGGRQAGALHGGHDDYHLVTDAGWFQWFARDVQEAADLAAIAHRVAELSLTPGIVAQDLYRTSHAVCAVEMPGADVLTDTLGAAGDTIDTPTPAQHMLFGPTRRRVPRLVDADRPVGIGGVQDRESYPKAMLAQRLFFAHHLAEITADAMRVWGERTGRRYDALSLHRVDDADVVVLAQGSVLDELEAAADWVREHDGIKAGVVGLRVLRPFPSEALASVLVGRRAVAVLERTDQPLAAHAPLTREVQAALDDAAPRDRRGGDRRPVVTTGIYGVGGSVPTVGDLVPVFREAAGDARRLVYVGTDLTRSMRRFPHLQTVQQQLVRDYPDVASVSLPPVAIDAPPLEGVSVVDLVARSSQGGLVAGGLFARALATATGRRAWTFPDGGLERDPQPTELLLAHAEAGVADVHTRPSWCDAALVAGTDLLDAVAAGGTVAPHALVLVESTQRGEALWASLPRHTRGWVRDLELQLMAVDAAAVASASASQPAYVDQLALWALLGAYAARALPAEVAGAIGAALREQLIPVFGDRHYLTNDVVAAFTGGAEAASEVAWREAPADEAPATDEGEAPWTVREAESWDPSVYDATRFWHSIGYLYASGKTGDILTDPYIATGIVPARTSAFRNVGPQRLRVPEWLPEKCTACGACWAACPESSLPPTAQTVAGLIDAAAAGAEAAGGPLIQFKRVADPVARQAHRLVSKDDGLNQFTHTDALLRDAFAQVADKLGLEGEKLDALNAEFERVVDVAGAYPIARTETFFEALEGAEKGSGRVVSLALNPLSCTGCGVCVEECPEDAFDWASEDAERSQALRAAWEFQATLPPVPAALVEAKAAEKGGELQRLLDRDAYHTLVGGEGSIPASGAKIAVHLVTAALDATVGVRYREHAARLGDLVERLRAKIQGDVSRAVAINDFAEFSRRLDRLGDGDLTPDALVSAASGDGSAPLDTARLKRLTALVADLEAQRRAYDGGRARMVLAIDSAAARAWSGTYPYNPHTAPWICHGPGEGAPIALGLAGALAGRVADEARVVRAATLELDDAYDPAADDARLAALGPLDLTEDERALVPPVLVLAEAGRARTDDIARLAAAGGKIHVVLVDPLGADLEGTIAVPAVEGAMVVRSSIGVPDHLIAAAVQAAGAGTAVFHVHAPDPEACGIAPERVVAQARLAVESRAFPVFVREGSGAVSLAGNPSPGADWTTRTMHFREPSGVESALELPVTVADWAAGEARFQDAFRVVPKGELAEHMTPLDRYLALEEGAREGAEPFIHLAGDGERHVLALVGPGMARLAGGRLADWRRLQGEAAAATQEQVGGIVEPATPPAAPAPAPAAVAAAAAPEAMQGALVERLLALCGFTEDPAFFQRSLRDFVVGRAVPPEDTASEPDA